MATLHKDWDKHVVHAEEVARTPGFLDLRDSILEHAEPLPGDRVLDVGAGTGLVTLALAPRVARVWALDISPAMCDYLRTKSDPDKSRCSRAQRHDREQGQNRQGAPSVRRPEDAPLILSGAVAHRSRATARGPFALSALGFSSPIRHLAPTVLRRPGARSAAEPTSYIT